MARHQEVVDGLIEAPILNFMDERDPASFSVHAVHAIGEISLFEPFTLVIDLKEGWANVNEGEQKWKVNSVRTIFDYSMAFKDLIDDQNVKDGSRQGREEQLCDLLLHTEALKLLLIKAKVYFIESILSVKHSSWSANSTEQGEEQDNRTKYLTDLKEYESKRPDKSEE